MRTLITNLSTEIFYTPIKKLIYVTAINQLLEQKKFIKNFIKYFSFIVLFN